jgi:ankyrin repeat protein
MKPEIWDWLQNHNFSVAQPVLRNAAGIYPLILASQQGRSDVVKFLLEQNAALDVLDEYGNNPLWAACYAENSDCIEALVDAGVNIKAISKNEYTRIAQHFCLFSRRKKGRIAGYVTLFTTQKMDKKTSKLGIFFAGNRLIIKIPPLALLP